MCIHIQKTNNSGNIVLEIVNIINVMRILAIFYAHNIHVFVLASEPGKGQFMINTRVHRPCLPYLLR